MWTCPDCNESLERFGRLPDYCHTCGTDRTEDHLPSSLALWDEDAIDISAALDNEEDAIEGHLPYPLEWYSGRIQLDLHNRVGWRCEHCGMEFEPGSTLARTARRRDGRPVVLTVHHLDGDPANCDWTNLLACCQTCHLHIQAVWKPGGVLPAHWPQPPRWIAERGLPYVPSEQLMLWPEWQ